ncbi:recombinase family protein [Streptomyces sp. NPDC059866]|uniref:recombinase family protein n=1 Tax=Streptomyces sp. NPDC059866 TaxID=3346978 RepID=UPI003648BB23
MPARGLDSRGDSLSLCPPVCRHDHRRSPRNLTRRGIRDSRIREVASAGPPLVRTEIKIGYARVSTDGQKLERQIDALAAAGCRKLFADKKSGKNALRAELKACHTFLDPGDTLVVPSLDRYGRSLQNLINMVAELRERGIGFTSLHENLDTTPGGRLVFHVFAALVEFIRELIVIGTNEGLAAARVGGRPTVATEEVIRAARDLLPDPGRSITSIAALLGVSPRTLYNHIPDLRELRAGTLPASSKRPRGR